MVFHPGMKESNCLPTLTHWFSTLIGLNTIDFQVYCHHIRVHMYRWYNFFSIQSKLCLELSNILVRKHWMSVLPSPRRYHLFFSSATLTGRWIDTSIHQTARHWGESRIMLTWHGLANQHVQSGKSADPTGHWLLDKAIDAASDTIAHFITQPRLIDITVKIIQNPSSIDAEVIAWKHNAVRMSDNVIDTGIIEIFCSSSKYLLF